MSSTQSKSSQRRPSGANRKAPAKGSRSNGAMIVVGVVVVLVLIVGAFFILGKSSSGSSTATNSSAQTTPAPASLVQAVANVPQSVINQIGYNSKLIKPATAVNGVTPLVSNGKPELLYIGAEYCPYCAAMRWPLVEALSKFGTFTHLNLTHSSSSDVYPNTNTFSFYGSKYQSQYIDFQSVETTTNQLVNGNYPTLQTPDKSQQAALNALSSATSGSSAQSIPFIDFGNKYWIAGASYSPQILSGLTWDSIAGALSNPNTLPAQGIDQTASMITATICKITNNQPSNVCTTPLMKKIEATLGS